MSDEGSSAPDPGRIIRSIVRGRKKSAEHRPDLDDLRSRWAIEAWFIEQTKDLREIRGWLNEFEFSQNRAHREESGRLLTAYFAWARFGGFVEGSANHLKIKRLATRFLDVVLARMIGFENRNGNFNELPRWSSPNAAFGWDAPAHRVKQDHTWRDMAIWAGYELLIRQKVKPTEAVRRLAVKFAPQKIGRAKNAGVSTVQKALANRGRSSLFLGSWTDEELREMARMRDYP